VANIIKKLNKYNYFPKDYKFKTQPYQHQLMCFNIFKDKLSGALFLEMGLGKTKIVIDICAYLYEKKEVRKILYVCPNSILDNVENEFKQHSPVPFRLYKLQGKLSNRKDILNIDKPGVYIINYEAIHCLGQELFKANFDMAICDESSRIKNPKAKCSKSLHSLAKFISYKFILTGTPVTQNAIDIFSQYKFLDPTIFGPSFISFRYAYAIMGGYMNHQIIGYKNLEQLKQLIYTKAIRYTKEECLDLPEKIYEVRKFDLNDFERKIYNEIKEKILVEVKNEKITTPIILTKLIKLLQICSGFIKTDEGSGIVFDEPSKLKLLREIIEDIGNKKIIIWAQFKQNITSISDLLVAMDIGHVKFDGDVAPEKRSKLVDSFQNDPSIKVFIGQIQTGGLGINLTAASYVIYYTNTYSLAMRLQSEDRAHRIGQKNNVTYIDLVARKSIDETLLKVLKKKEDFSIKLIDNLEDLI
jgi:SNF2 family DNA or RNA helicase